MVVMRVMLALAVVGALAWQEQAPNRREFTIIARDQAFSPARIEVSQDDIVKITFRSEDRPHSFAIDAYRIVKRAGTGQSVTFEFRADRVGSFPYYCNLTTDERCREMKGTLVVKPR
jgi:heme/copper-type cytochrome/quinol oxidase subunit 2